MYTKEDLVESYKANYDNLCKYATALTGNRDNALDIVQMLAIKILELDENTIINDLESLLFTAAKRIVIDVYRKEKRIVYKTPDEMAQFSSDEYERTIQLQELEQAVSDSLKMFPEDMRRILIRNKLRGESIASISRETGISAVVLRKQISRMIAKIPKDILLFTAFISAINEIACHTFGISNVI